MLITPEYAALQQAFHLQRPDYGANAHRWADRVLDFATKLDTRDILDYGCGKGTLAKNLPFPIRQYDPAIPEHDRPPDSSADLVCALDVLEHIEPGCLDAVLADLSRLTRRAFLAEIATRPANKFLPDGRNAHLIQQPPNWWIGKLLPHFDLHSVQATKGALIVLGFAFAPDAPPAAEAPQAYMPEAAATGELYA